MLLRSSSTPILGSLLHSSSTQYFSESPTTTRHHHSPAHRSFSCHLSPLPDSGDKDPPSSGVRRTRSDGNLKGLLSDHHEDPHHHQSLRCSSSRRPNQILETIPSFSKYHSRELDEEEEEEEIEERNVPQGPVAVGGGIGREFSFSGEKHDVGHDENADLAGGKVASPLFLARGLGIDRVGSGLMNAGRVSNGDGGGHYNGGEQSDLEMYYKKMIEEDSSNAVFLRNYAQFLYQTKGDLLRAEEYYSRAILVEPGDGEILSQYAKLVWELHHDEERASSYFERAVQAAPQDSHVLAAYAGFLWEAEDDDNDCRAGGGDGRSQHYAGFLHQAVV